MVVHELDFISWAGHFENLIPIKMLKTNKVEKQGPLLYLHPHWIPHTYQ